jgi:hypothetical protein
MIVIQVVTIAWTKATRGAPHAGQRTELPRAFVVPQIAGECSIQQIVMEQSHDYRPRAMKTRSAKLPRIYEGAIGAFLASPDKLEISLRGKSLRPERHSLPQLMSLSPGQFGRLCVNQRHTSYYGQSYSEETYNIAFGSHIAADYFVSREPDVSKDFLVDLF